MNLKTKITDVVQYLPAGIGYSLLVRRTSSPESSRLWWEREPIVGWAITAPYGSTIPITPKHGIGYHTSYVAIEYPDQRVQDDFGTFQVLLTGQQP